MWIAEAIPPAGPLFIPALAALFAICACIVAIGMVKLVDAISRSFFGTLSGAVAWIPYAGKVAEHSLHKVEQKISHGLGSAEQKLDGYVALSWHHMAGLYRFLAHEISGGAVTAWHLAQQARAFVMQRDMHHAIRASVAPIRSRVANVGKVQAHDHARTKALSHSVAQGVYPRLKAGEVYDRTVAQPNVRTARAEAKAAEEQAIATYRWLVKHRLSVLTGVFTGAVAFALARLGGGWIRCKNWRAIGKHVCRMPWKTIEGLLSLALAFLVVVDPLVIAKSAVKFEDEFDGLIRDIANPSQAVTDATQVAMDVLETISKPLAGIVNP